MVKNLKHKPSKLEDKMPASERSHSTPNAEASNRVAAEEAASPPIALDAFASMVQPMTGATVTSRSNLPDMASFTAPKASPISTNRVGGIMTDSSLPESNTYLEAKYMGYGYPPTAESASIQPSHAQLASTNWPHYYPHLSPQHDTTYRESLYQNYQQYLAERRAREVDSLYSTGCGSENTTRQTRDEFINNAILSKERARVIARMRAQEEDNRRDIAGPPRPTIDAMSDDLLAQSETRWGVKVGGENKLKAPEAYTEPFCQFMTENPTVWHAVSAFEDRLTKSGFQKLSERKTWNEELTKGGKYFISRNGSSLIAFTVGNSYKSGNGVAMVGGHVDALTARLKPVSNKRTAAGYVQLGVAPYAGGLNSTWWDRDLGIGGRVVVKDSKTGKITTKLVKLGWPIARIPTLAPHFGVGMMGQSNQETQMVPIIGLDSSEGSSTTEEFANLTLGGVGSFAATQPPKLVKAIAGELSITDYSSIINWELELYDTQPAQTLGLDREFISAGRIDDKLCSWAAIEGLLADAASSTSSDDGIVKLAGVFDDEEIGSQLRQGAKGNFLPSIIERITEAFAPSGTLSGANLLSQTYANSFLLSADVTHAINPNFQSSYQENHAPRLNVGLCIGADSNGHLTTDAVSTALLTRIAEKTNNKLQLFMIRNDSRSGGTIGPMLSSMMGVRAIDAGIPQLSMHSIRATIGNLDPGLGVKIFAGFFGNYEAVDAEFDPAMG